MTGILAEFERWGAELLEVYLSYPLLMYYRSQHDRQSWLAALVAVAGYLAVGSAVEGDLVGIEARAKMAARVAGRDAWVMPAILAASAWDNSRRRRHSRMRAPTSARVSLSRTMLTGSTSCSRCNRATANRRPRLCNQSQEDHRGSRALGQEC